MARTATDSGAPRLRWPYLALAYGCIGLGGLGVVLPGLPTTPFLLVAAWAASRGSERLHRRLLGHRHFGPLLHHWHTERAVPARAKLVAIVLLVLSWGVLAWRADGPLVPVVAGVFFLAVSAFLLSRPQPGAGRRRVDKPRELP